MLRTVTLAAIATIAIAATAPQARAQFVSYGGVHYPPPPGPYGGYAPVPYAYGYGPYGGGLVTSNVSYGYYGAGRYSGPFRTDSAPGSIGGF